MLSMLHTMSVDCRALHGPDGRFIVDNINEWQHSAMYLAFLISGVVDLVGFYAPKGTLPPGTEQVSSLPLSSSDHLPAPHGTSKWAGSMCTCAPYCIEADMQAQAEGSAVTVYPCKAPAMYRDAWGWRL